MPPQRKRPNLEQTRDALRRHDEELAGEDERDDEDAEREGEQEDPDENGNGAG